MGKTTWRGGQEGGFEIVIKKVEKYQLDVKSTGGHM